MKKLKRNIKKFFKRFITVVNRSDMVVLPGNLAFYIVLAIIPTITLITYLASNLNLSTVVISNFLESAFSKDVAAVFLSTSASSYAGLQLTVVLIFCYYIASNGMNSMIVTSNAIYGIKNGNWFKRRLKAIFMSIVFVLLIVFLLVIPIFGDQIINLIETVNMNANVTSLIVKVYSYLQNPLMWILLFIMIKLLYVLAPDRQIKAYKTNYGAIFTTVMWILTTWVYSYYINHFADVTAVYGGLASLCVMMIWFFFLAFFFVIGMSLNYQKEIEELEETTSIKTQKK